MPWLCPCTVCSSAQEVARTTGSRAASACNVSHHQSRITYEIKTFPERRTPGRRGFMWLFCLPAVMQWLHEQELLFLTFAVAALFPWFLWVWTSAGKLNQRCWTLLTAAICVVVVMHVLWDALKGLGSHPKCWQNKVVSPLKRLIWQDLNPPLIIVLLSSCASAKHLSDHTVAKYSL